MCHQFSPASRSSRRPSRSRLAAMTAAALVLLAGTAIAQTGAPASSAARAAQASASTQAELPLRSVTLYRSGVGSFRLEGKVQGNKTVTLQFGTQQVNDILKSMVVLDLDGGTVGAVTFGSNQPLSKRLEAFGIDVSGAPSVESLLRQFAGEQIELETSNGKIVGTILSVENKSVPVASPSGESMIAMSRAFVNLWSNTGLRQVALDDVRNFTLSNQALAEDLGRALATLSGFRAERRTAMDVQLNGTGSTDRRVVIGYTHEMPVWKTSYRLVLSDDNASPTLDAKGIPTAKATVQGWAIVENTTDSDWNDIRLSLASGRPVSFTMNLHESLFIERPELPVPGFAVVSSTLYKSADRMPAPAAPAFDRSARSNIAERAVTSQSTQAGGMFADAIMEADTLGPSQSTGEEVGGQFMYTVDAPVTIPRGQSSMLPVIVTEIPARHVSIFNPSDMPKHPMKGVELVNTTGLHLMPGPIAVYDTGAYAGDAQIAHTSRNQNRLLSYALDIDVFINHTSNQTQRTSAMRIVDGLLEHTVKRTSTTTYAIQNFDANRARTIIIEHPQGSGWDLITPKKPKEIASGTYRFEVTVPAGSTIDYPVAFERTDFNKFTLVNWSTEQFLSYAINNQAPAGIIEAARAAARLNADIIQARKEIDAINGRMSEIDNDQSRIRNNLSRIGNDTDLRQRYLTTLNEQENEIEDLIERRDAQQKLINDRDAELKQFLRDLKIN